MNCWLLYLGLGGDIKEASRKGLERGAKRIQKNAKYLAPVKEGHLRNSIRTKSKTTQNGVEAQVFTNTEYAPYVEFGTGLSGLNSNIERPDTVMYKVNHHGQAAQPYMTPAYLHSKNNNTVEKEVERTIQSEINKLGRGK